MPNNDTIPKWEDVTPIEDSAPKWEDVTPIDETVKKKEESASGNLESGDSPSLSDTTKLTPQKESEFQNWWNTNPAVVAWKKDFKKTYGEEPQQGGDYDYRGAFEAGVTPSPYPEDGNHYHWDSIGLDGKDLKSQHHPTRWKSEYMKLTNINPDEENISYEDAVGRYKQLEQFAPEKSQEATKDEQGLKDFYSEAITPKTPIQSVSEGMSKNQGVLEKKYAEYVTKKTAEITGGLNIPNPLTSPDPETFKADMDNYQRVLRESPMAEKDNEKITAIGQLMQKAKETDEVVKDYDKNSIIGNVGEGIKKGIEDYGRGYFELAKTLDTNTAVKDLSSKLEKLDKGENVPLDEGDKLLMQAIGESTNKAKQLEALDPTAFNIGHATGTSLGFTGEFLMTGGLGAGVAKSIAAGTVKSVAEGATVSLAKRIGVGLSAKLAQTGIQVAAMPTFYKGIAEDVSKGEGFGESLFKNYYNTFSENFTERIFLKNPWNQSTVGAVDNFMGRLGVNMHTDKGLVGILASTGEEVLEEKIGDIMEAPLNYDNFKDFWKDYWDVKKNAELIGSVALMVAPMGIVSYSAKKWDDVQLNKTGKLLTGGIRSELDEVLNDQKLSLKEQYDLVGRIVESHAADQTLGDNPAEMAGNIIRYVQGKTKASVSSGIEDRAKTPTIGEMEEITPEDQAKVDYLQGQGVKIPDGTGMVKVNEMYEAEKAKKVPVNVNTIDEEKDKEIAAAQKKLNLPKAPELRVSDETQTTLDKIDGNEPVTNEFIKKASDDLYAKYKELEAMKSADTRQFTTEQINDAQDFLGEEITRLENFAAKQAENEDFIAGENLSKIENISTETENIPPENVNTENQNAEKVSEIKSDLSESQSTANTETENSLQKENVIPENIDQSLQNSEPLIQQKDETQQERLQATEKITPEPKKIKEATKKVADTLRKAKFIQSMDDLSKLSSDPTAILKVAWDGSVEAAAKTIELGGSVAQAVADGVKALRESEWYKKLSDESKKIAEERFTKDIGKALKESPGKTKNSRYGTRVAFGEKTQEPVKEKYKKEELYTYKEETHGEVDAAADKFLATATNDEALLSLHDKNIPVRVRTSIAYGLVARLNTESTPLFAAGNKAEYDPIMDKIVEVHKFVQDELATEAGRDVSYFGSNRVMQLLGGYQVAELARRGMQDSRNEQMKRKSFTRTSDHAQKEVEKEKKKVIEEVIDKIVKPKESKVAPEIEKIRKERGSLIDQWKKARKSAAYSSVIPGLTQADIEFIPQLAASYIKEGFYQTKVLVKKIQRILDNEGIKVSDADLETLLPKEYNGMPLSEHQQAEDLKKASLSLAKQIFGDVIDKKNPDSDPIVRMVKTLFSKFKETQLDRKAVEGMSDLEKLALAIREKDKYKSVWIEAKQTALNIVENNKNLSDEQKETAVERIEAAYKNATEFTFSQKLITDLIKEELSGKGMDLGDVVRDHYESKDVVKADLVKSLVEKSGLTSEQAKTLADAVDKAFSTLMTSRIQGVLKKYIEKGTRKTSSKQKKGAEEIVHLASIGAFDNEKFREAFADTWGLANLDDSDIKYIISQSEMITKIKSEAIRYDYKQQLLAHIANMQGMDWDALIDGFWYANVLSGLGTQLKNSLDAATAATVESALYSGTSPFQINRFRRAFARALKTRGMSNMRHTLRTGNHPFELGTDAPRQAKRVLDSAEALVENKKLWAAIKTTAKYENTVFNIMMSSDALWGTVAYESILDAIVTKEIYNEAKNGGIKLNKEQREAISQKIDEMLKITPQDRAIIAEMVAQESEDFKVVQAGLGEDQTGFSKEQEMLRTYELMDEMRPKILVDEARRLAQMTLGNIQPFGLLGYGMSHISNIVNTVGFKFYKPIFLKVGNKLKVTFSGTESITLRPFSKIIPFTRIITSLATRALNWNPYVMGLRSATGQYGSLLWIGGKQTERFRKKLTPHEKKVLAKKAIILGLAYSVLYGLTGGDEPEKGWIRITANGTGDWKGKNKQLEGSGWRAWNLQIGDYSFGYQYIYPLNGILGAFGYARDQQLYNGADKSFGSFMKLLAEGSGVSLMQVLFSTPLSGLNTGLDILTELYRGNVDTAMKFITKLTTNIGGGIVSPRILKDMESMYDTLAKRADIQGATFAEKMSDKIPFIGRNFAGKIEAIDIMGSSIKVKSPVSAVFDFNTGSKNSDLIQWLTEEVKYFRPIPTYEQEKFIVQEKGGSFNESRTLTAGSDTEEALWTEYNRKLGQLFKENVSLWKSSGLTPEEINTELKSSWGNTVKQAKSYILELSMSHPLDKPQK